MVPKKNFLPTRVDNHALGCRAAASTSASVQFFHQRMKYFTTMLDYSKTILERVSFSPALFRKEYRKALKRLHPLEAAALRMWLREQQQINSNLK